MVRLQQNIIRFYLNLERVCLEARGKGLIADGTVEGSNASVRLTIDIGVGRWALCFCYVCACVCVRLAWLCVVHSMSCVSGCTYPWYACCVFGVSACRPIEIWYCIHTTRFFKVPVDYQSDSVSFSGIRFGVGVILLAFQVFRNEHRSWTSLRRYIPYWFVGIFDHRVVSIPRTGAFRIGIFWV